MLGFDVLRQGRVCSRDSKFKDLRHGVASVDISYLIKRDNYLTNIYLLAITRYFSFIVINCSINEIDLLLFPIL